MWYKNGSKDKLDYSKPIFAVGKNTTHILLPVRLDNPIRHVYDWFDLSRGAYNSYVGWDCPEDAVSCYSRSGNYIIKNGEITVNYTKKST